MVSYAAVTVTFWAGMVRAKNTDEPGNIGRSYEVAGTSLKYCTSGGLCTYPGKAETDRAGLAEEHKNLNMLAGFDGAQWPVCSIMAPIITGLFRNLKEWAEKGVSLPIADYIDSRAEYPDFELFLDENGNQKGGVRTHYVEVPVATYTDNGEIIPFTTEKKASLYGSRENWLKLTKDYLNKMVKDRWIVAEDADMLYAEAERAPW